MASLGYGRNQILSLYRSCRRSMLRIPDPAQRQMYDIYLKTSFRAKQHLVPESRQAIFAIDDAREQLERMNYFHSIREEKQRQQQVSKASNDKVVRPAPTLTKDPTNANSTKKGVVQNWLKEALPHLHYDDLARYTSHLVEDGFDSVELLETDLMQEDMDFMKKAHRRALIRVKGLDKRES